MTASTSQASSSTERLKWRSPSKVQERHAYIIELAEKGFLLKEIARICLSKFGNPWIGDRQAHRHRVGEGAALDHTTIIHHLKKHDDYKCLCNGTSPRPIRKLWKLRKIEQES